MVYKRYNAYGKKSYKGKKKYSVDRWQTKQIKYIKRELAPEKKVLDIDSDIFIDNTDWYIIPTSLMAEGTEYNTRIGRKIRAKSIFIRGQFRMNQGATATTCRMIIFYDKASNGSVPQASAVMQDVRDLQSPLDVDNSGTRFIVLKDKTVDLSINGDQVKSFYVYKKLKHLITFNGSSNTSSELTTGHVYVMFLCNETSASDKRASVNFWSRFTFTDS